MKSLARRLRFVATIATTVCFLLSGAVMPLQKCGAYSMSEEKELGRRVLEAIRKHMQLVDDGEVLTYVQSVGNRVVRQFGVTPYEYKFFVINESIPNAFAVPGGYIFIYRGLIEMMDNEGELASILCHECGHIQARHMQRQAEQGRILTIASLVGLLAGVLLGVKGGGATPALAMGASAGAQSAALQYSREYETEADQIGFHYLCDAGYPPANMVSIMEKLYACKWLMNSRVPSYLMTHPALYERIQYLQDLVQQQKNLANKPALSPSLGDFTIMKAALVADYADPAKAMDRFQADTRKNPAEAAYGFGRLDLRMGNNAEALPKLLEASRLRAGSPLVLCSLGSAYHQMGKLTEAQKAFETALLLDPLASIAHYRLALVLQDLGRKDEALQHLNQIQNLASVFPDIDYQMGILLGQLNQIGLAHLHLGRYYENKQDLKLALFHYKKARGLLKDSVARIDELDQSIKEIEKIKKNKASTF